MNKLNKEIELFFGYADLKLFDLDVVSHSFPTFWITQRIEDAVII